MIARASLRFTKIPGTKSEFSFLPHKNDATQMVCFHRLSFEAEPADFEKVLADWNLTKLKPEERNG